MSNLRFQSYQNNIEWVTEHWICNHTLDDQHSDQQNEVQ